jgi:hypothetical protein
LKKILIATTLLGGCAHAAPPPAPTFDRAREESAVWAAVVDQLFARQKRDKVWIRASILSRAEMDPMPSLRKIPGVDDDTQADFLANNRGVYQISRIDSTATAVGFIPDSVFTAIQEAGRGGLPGPEGYWRSFYSRYPNSGGYFTLTRPGFSADGRHAYLITGFHCGGLCGEGHDVILLKENGRWRVADARMTWIS